ncbi:MAG: hypothetical protein IJW04_04580 [Ruminococcus sp.]|nr:hypothetical protein [Ruminococcus sp.]
MSIYKSITEELRRFGEDITVTTENGIRVVKGILEPLLYKNKLYLGGKQLPHGYFDSGNYLLICPPEAKLPVLGTAFVEAKGRKFILKRSEIVTARSEDFYVWAVLMPYSEPKEEDFYEA